MHDHVLRKYNLPLNNYHRYGLQFNIKNYYSQLLFILLVGDVATNPGPSKPVKCVSLNARSLKNSHNIDNNNLKVLYLNARSIKSFIAIGNNPSKKVCKITLLQELVSTGDYEVICICETWLNKTVLDSELLPGFNTFRRDRNGKIGGGVLIAVKEGLQATRRCDLERDGAEFVVVQLNKVNNSSIILYTYYRKIGEILCKDRLLAVNLLPLSYDGEVNYHQQKSLIVFKRNDQSYHVFQQILEICFPKVPQLTVEHWLQKSGSELPPAKSLIVFKRNDQSYDHDYGALVAKNWNIYHQNKFIGMLAFECAWTNAIHISDFSG
ncbi:RNA-directed DNA polymerase from mobile element jockey [Paramuricea clavata]|uniref:RNA-directed DNA polymerase from mobile element jockey n=1 Tax=Paramuricea clavata TaxID=317549 RepID=A0A7D9EB43_PARCT|nr:RNA-directed DNA polymerase from mobile element jockey [Paramuricea clavata]